MEETFRKELVRIYQKYGHTNELHDRVVCFINSMTVSLGYEKAMEVSRSIRLVTL